GPFTFTVGLATGAVYSVSVATNPSTPTPMNCTVTMGNGAVPSADVTNIVVTCAPLHTIGGTVSGLTAGDTLVLQDNGGNNLPVNANGAFTFTTPLMTGATYSVTILENPTAPPLTCTVTSGTGTG